MKGADQNRASSFLSSYESCKYPAHCRSQCPDITKILHGHVFISGWWPAASALTNNVNMWDDFTVFLLLDNLRYSDWSAWSEYGLAFSKRRRQTKEQLYLHVAYQNLYHAGPENMQLIASVRYGKQISQCQDVSQSSRRKRERGGKQKNRSYFLGLSRKSSSCMTFSFGVLISQGLQIKKKFRCLAAYWQQKYVQET